jgi:hypothetical protein
MSLDFTLDKYRALCKAAADSQYAVLGVKSYLTMPNLPPKFIILRHDVDRKPDKAVRMAEIEREYGLKSSYYFKYNRKVFQPNLIKKVADAGHEIGYHYETLDKARGDYEKAIQIFQEELKSFREICEVDTICMHGNSLTRWVNRDLWQRYDFRDFGLIGEGYLSVPLDKMLYLSDTGRTWSGKHKVKDHVNKNNTIHIKSTSDLIDVIKAGEADHICIVAHPNRWSKHFTYWLRQYAFDTTANLVKVLAKPLLSRS